jgi:hypothetical protein
MGPQFIQFFFVHSVRYSFSKYGQMEFGLHVALFNQNLYLQFNKMLDFLCNRGGVLQACRISMWIF